MLSLPPFLGNRFLNHPFFLLSFSYLSSFASIEPGQELPTEVDDALVPDDPASDAYNHDFARNVCHTYHSKHHNAVLCKAKQLLHHTVF